eukprot:1161217-Pelagomonas_calceolata.AAC.2
MSTEASKSKNHTLTFPTCCSAHLSNGSSTLCTPCPKEALHSPSLQVLHAPCGSVQVWLPTLEQLSGLLGQLSQEVLAVAPLLELVCAALCVHQANA